MRQTLLILRLVANDGFIAKVFVVGASIKIYLMKGVVRS